MNTKCECCGREIEKTANQIYCFNCSPFIHTLKSKIGRLRLENKRLKEELYETDNKRMKVLDTTQR